MRTAWLLFFLIVITVVCLPKLHADEPALAICKNSLCVIAEETLDLLISLAGKAGKECI